MLVRFVEREGGNQLRPLVSREMLYPPRKDELVTLQLTLGGPREVARVVEVIWDLPNIGTVGEDDPIACPATVILARPFTEADYEEAVRRYSVNQGSLFRAGHQRTRP